MPPMGSCAFPLGPQFVVLFGKIEEPLGSGALWEE